MAYVVLHSYDTAIKFCKPTLSIIQGYVMIILRPLNLVDLNNT